MSNSGRLINYGLRPAKHIERKMMRDLFLRMFAFNSLSSYQYIGFGAKYFIDFHLFHKSLHIDKMVSIEGDTNNRKRYNFNKPFDCIEMVFGLSQDVLPKLDLSIPTIMWLDYDSRFKLGMLDDLSTIISKLSAGSIFSFSYNAETYSKADLSSSDGTFPADAYKQKFIEIVGEDNIPPSFSERGWTKQTQFSEFLYNSVIARLKRALSERNSRLDNENKLIFRQVMYFDYADGQRMETLSFVLFKQSDVELYERCNFSSLPFFRDGSMSFNISTPNFTIKEIRHLSEQMPNIDYNKLDKSIYAEKDVRIFSELYKYFPSFNEVELI